MQAPTAPEQGRVLGKIHRVMIRVLDLLVASLALVILSPLIVVLVVLIRLDSPGPIIYRQLRVGVDRRRGPMPQSVARHRLVDLGGRPFLIHKFRTMYVNSEAVTGPVWAAADDDRMTRLGRWLRRYRLDEIPQFWDVLRGDMSVVGPRPERPNFVGRLRREITDYPLRHRVRPGITGWAQVNSGYDSSVDDVRQKLKYDLEYVRRKSVWFDLFIMVATLPVMFLGGGSEPDDDLLPQDTRKRGGQSERDG